MKQKILDDVKDLSQQEILAYFKKNKNKDNKIYLFEKTSFLNVDSSIFQRLYHLKNNLNSKVLCKECHKEEAKWKRNHYKTCGNHSCVFSDRNKKSIETVKKKYNVDNVSKIEFVKKKIKKVLKERYNHENPAWGTNRKKVEKTIKQKYGSFEKMYEENAEKTKKTFYKKYNVSNINKTKKHRERLSKLAAERYDSGEKVFGMKYGTHNPTKLLYQGSYEKHFLDTFYQKFKIEKAPRIKYEYEGIERTYIPDFYLPEKNLIVEIKSLYTFNLHKKINLAKEQACLKQGYKFMFVIDKNYLEWMKFIASL